MPTRYKPELNHQSLSHKAVSERIHSELRARGAVILDLVGFYGKFGRPDVPGYTGRQEAAELLNEIAGLLAMALTIRLEAGEKAPRKVIATLKAILKHPHLALCDGTEPEAKGLIGAYYQRADEKPGRFWFDLEGFGNEPDEAQIRLAAQRAIHALEAEIKLSRPVAQEIQYLVPRLRAIFLRFNNRITRKTIHSSKGHSEYYSKEEGPFFLFVKEVLGPLHRLLSELSNDGRSSLISADYITRLAAKGSPNKDAQLTP